MKLLVKKLDENAIVPTKAHENDAGYDLYALEECILYVSVPQKIRTGIALQLDKRISILTSNGVIKAEVEDTPNHVGIIHDRSSLGSKGIKVMGGVIDSNYTGEIIICLVNLDYSRDRSYYTINKGDKIAQIVFYPIFNPVIETVDVLEDTQRGSKGFGSSGK